VGLGEHAHERRRRADEADLPPREIEDLARRADLYGPLAHAGKRDHRGVAAPVEDDVLPDLVAERDRVVADAELGEQAQVLVGEDRGGRVERVVEESDLGPWGKGARQRLLGEAKSGGLQRHETRHAAGRRTSGR
jgi:hypothetical protein